MEILFTKRQGGWKEKGKSNKGNKMENLVQCLDNFNTKALQWLQCRQDNLVWVVWEAIWIGYTVKRKTNFLWVLSCHHTTATEIRSIKENKVVNNPFHRLCQKVQNWAANKRLLWIFKRVNFSNFQNLLPWQQFDTPDWTENLPHNHPYTSFKYRAREICYILIGHLH